MQTHLMKRLAVVGAAFLTLLIAVPGFSAHPLPTTDEQAGQATRLDPVEFLKRFTIGMSYEELQEALPKTVLQDSPSYIVSDEVFVLTVDIPGPGSWSATFKFDTVDAAVRRPEQLIEISCSATVSSRKDPFDSIVRKVAESYGEPLQLDRTQDKFQEAGWRVNRESVLKLEYSIVPSSLTERDASIDLIVKKHKPRKTPNPKAVA